MAYSVNGKVYTDHPLMDEIVDNCKAILNSIVVKNDTLAISYETEESLALSRELFYVTEDKYKFDNFPFSSDMLKSFTKDGERVFTDEEVAEILSDRYLVPVNLRSELLAFCKKYYIDNYEDINNYYRSLAGLPPYEGTVINIRRERSDAYYNIFVYREDFPSDYDTSHLDHYFDIVPGERPICPDNNGNPCVYIHLLNSIDISILEQSGFIDEILNDYKGFNYSYIRYLGYKSIDSYKARKAIKWEILYMPKVEQLVQQRFEELYNINRSIYLKKTYQEAMALGSDHYDESIILLLLCQTFNDMIVDVPQWYIRRDIFDLRSVQYFLESYGVEYFPVIPLKYQVAIVKNLNKLIKYKSSNKNNNDIIDLFNLEGTFIYKYYLYKKAIDSGDPDNYKLEFIKVKQGEPFDKYISNNIYRFDYDDFTLQDKYWDGVYKEWGNSSDKTFKERLHEEVKDNHIEYTDYTVTGTKYMSVDYEVDMSKYKYQVEYFFNFLLDSKTDTDDIKIILPTVDVNTEVEISNIFIMLYLLSFSYDDIPDKVIRPEDRDTHKQTIENPPYEYYEQVYTDDGDFDDVYKWNELFDDYIIPPTIDEHGHKHWEIKSYIEHRDPVATEEGYNSYPVWVEKYLDWVKNKFPETLTTEYNRILGFNNALETEDLDNLLELISRRNKVYNFERGYNGYSYQPVYDLDNNLLYYEIIYEYDEYDRIYNYNDYLNYICYPNEPVFDPDTETIEEYEARHAQWEETLTQESYDKWYNIQIELYKHNNPRGPLGIGGFRVVKKMSTVPEIVDNFNINTECYNDLVSRINNADSRDENVILRYVYKVLCTREFDYDFYKVNDNDVKYMSEVLRNRNYILYNFYRQVISENNVETRRDNIRAVMNDIITTLEYYLSDNNLEYIYSSFSITSFSSLIYYMYLMINFFKSWKVYFLDPVVTINTDDKLENGNNYGTGVDNIAETKLNYWHQDKEFRRDTINLNYEMDVDERDPKERIKEVLDVYGRFDPDPNCDYDFDGYYPEEAQETYIDVDGGSYDASRNIPYHMVNGGQAFDKYTDVFDFDGGTPEEALEYLSLNGGGVYHPEDLVTRNSYDYLYNFNINGGGPASNYFYTKTIHTKVINREISQDVVVSTKEYNVIDQKNDGLYINQSWASWADFADIATTTDEAYSYINYILEVLYDDLIIITDDALLTEHINNLVDDQLANMIKVSDYAKNIEYHKNVYRSYTDEYVRTLDTRYDDFTPFEWINF